jgi:hypothetical protein
VCAGSRLKALSQLRELYAHRPATAVLEPTLGLKKKDETWRFVG